MSGSSLSAFLFAQKMNSIQTETFPEIYERHIKALVHHYWRSLNGMVVLTEADLNVENLIGFA